MISTIRQAKKDYYEASDRFLQIGHLLGGSGDKQQFHTKSTKMSTNFFQISNRLGRNGVK